MENRIFTFEHLGDNKIVQNSKAIQTTDSYYFSSMRQATTMLPSNLDVSRDALIAVQNIANISVRKQTSEILLKINQCLYYLNSNYGLSNCLSKLGIIEGEDDSALIEWNFEKFRIGFSLESDADESYYYIVTKDESVGAFMTLTKKIGSSSNIIIKEFVQYVLENT